MINLFLKNKTGKQKGAATIVITVLLLVTITLIILFAASYTLMRQKIASNDYRNNQAYQAAEAGLEFAVPYFQQNSTTILANPVSGYLAPFSNSSTQNVTLGNNSRYTITYTNPVANNYNLILITVVGTSDDGTATRTISQQVQFGSLLVTTPPASIVSKGSVSMTGSTNLVNTSTNTNISSGSTVSLSGSAQTSTSAGNVSSAGNLGSDILQNVSSLSSLSTNDFIATYLGGTPNQVKGSFTYYYTNSTNTNYSSILNNKTGTIWIDQTGGQATLSGSATIGTTNSPVLLVVNGNLNISGSVQINGLVIIIGDPSVSVTGSVQINGGLMTSGNLVFSGSTQINYTPSAFTKLQQSTSYYAKVPGSWKDF